MTVRSAFAFALTLACVSPLAAQWTLAPESHRGVSTELGFFTFGRDRYANDFEIGVHGAVGYRMQRSGLFVEPHLRAQLWLGDDGPECDDELGCLDVVDGAIDDPPLLWPGVTAGVVFGDDFFAQSLALRAAAGFGEVVHPLVGVRYEGSARWFGWFAELDMERIRWETEDERRWAPALLVGGRMFVRRVSVPRPEGPYDAGILPLPLEERDDPPAIPTPRNETRLLLWAQDEDRVGPPFVALIDADSASPTYGAVLTSAAVGEPGADAHHAQLPGATDGRAWVNSFGAAGTYLVDVRGAGAPSVVAQLAPAPGLSHPHSVVPLPGDSVLVTYQLDATGARPGGLALHAPDGSFVRAGSAIDANTSAFVRPYSAVVLRAIDRVVTTGADMHGTDTSRVVQLWRLSDLALLETSELPAGPRGNENADTFEPRVLPGGRVFVVTLACGLYVIDGVRTDHLQATLVHTFEDTRCFMPAVVGSWWIQTLARENAIEVLDLFDPSSPRVAARVELPAGWVPHWLATDRAGERVVVTGYRDMQRRVLLFHFDEETGALTPDTRFGDDAGAPGISLDGPSWPHGETGAAVPHGAIFVDAATMRGARQ